MAPVLGLCLCGGFRLCGAPLAPLRLCACQPVWASPPPTPSAQSQTSSTASGQSLMPYTRESSALSAGSAGSGSSLSALASPAGGGVAGLSGRAIGELSGSAVAGLGESLLGGHRQLMMGVMSLGLGGPASGHVAERGAGLGEGPGGGARAGAGVRVYARSIYVSCICAASRIFVSCTCVMHPVSYCVYASIRGADRRGRGDSRQDALSCLPARSRMGAHTHVRQF